MGDSVAANTVGTPATPRDGSAIEITGLQFHALSWISNEVLVHASNWWHWPGVSCKSLEKEEKVILYQDWCDMVSLSFEKYYYIPLQESDDVDYCIESSLVNRRGIYKDIYGSSLPYSDYQLRPNICIAMVKVIDF